MNFYQFKTNINCGSCVAAVTPFLNNNEAIENWEVDLQDEERTLSVESKDAESVITAIQKAGYKAELK
ncbi:MAG: heavy-metal-associated domain-containing protein [Cyclobacteriaceae bacterium]|nr:heavy-metal-associated domain-containing protein [Cyclobacteriaceae bacterium]